MGTTIHMLGKMLSQYLSQLHLETNNDTSIDTKTKTMGDINMQQPQPPTDHTQKVKFVCMEYGESQGPKTRFCTTCNSTVWTTVSTSTTTLGLIWFFLCYCCCCVCALLPFYLDTFKKYKHSCPKCGTLLQSITPTLSITKIVLF